VNCNIYFVYNLSMKTNAIAIKDEDY